MATTTPTRQEVLCGVNASDEACRKALGIPSGYTTGAEASCAKAEGIPVPERHAHYEGSGSPEDVVEGNQFDTYTDTDTDDVYVKTSEGTGTTGWVLAGGGGDVPILELVGSGTDEENLSTVGFTSYNQDSGLPGITELTINQVVMNEGFDFESCDTLTSLRCPLTTTLGPDAFCLVQSAVPYDVEFAALAVMPLAVGFNSGSFQLQGSIRSVSFPNLVTAEDAIDLGSASFLEEFSAPLLETAEYLSFANNPLLEELLFPALTTIEYVSIFQGMDALSEIDLSALETVTDYLFISSCAALTGELDLSSLQTVTNAITLDGNPLVTSIDLSSLTSFGGGLGSGSGLSGANCTTLTTVDVSSVTTVGGDITFTGCALDAATVNQILARAKAAGMASGSIDLSGGTSSDPTGQGITDKADLITAGVSVTTN